MTLFFTHSFLFLAIVTSKSVNNVNHRALLSFGSCIQAIGTTETVIPTHNLTNDWRYPGNGTNDHITIGSCANIERWAGESLPEVPTIRSGDNFENCSVVSQYCFTNTVTNMINGIQFEFQYSWGYQELDDTEIYSYFILALLSNNDTYPFQPSQLWSWTSPEYNNPAYSWDNCDGQRDCYSPLQVHHWNVSIDVSQAITPHFIMYFINQNKNLHILPETLVIKIDWIVTNAPTQNPTYDPTTVPTKDPTFIPTNYTSLLPNQDPTDILTDSPTYNEGHVDQTKTSWNDEEVIESKSEFMDSFLGILIILLSIVGVLVLIIVLLLMYLYHKRKEKDDNKAHQLQTSDAIETTVDENTVDEVQSAKDIRHNQAKVEMIDAIKNEGVTLKIDHDDSHSDLYNDVKTSGTATSGDLTFSPG